MPLIISFYVEKSLMGGLWLVPFGSNLIKFCVLLAINNLNDFNVFFIASSAISPHPSLLAISILLHCSRYLQCSWTGAKVLLHQLYFGNYVNVTITSSSGIESKDILGVQGVEDEKHIICFSLNSFLPLYVP